MSGLRAPGPGGGARWDDETLTRDGGPDTAVRSPGLASIRGTGDLGIVKPIKHSVAILTRDGDGRLLAVQRPSDDEDLPDAWGLPAGSLRPGEDWEEAVRRTGRDKLGVEVRPSGFLREGQLERKGYRLRMRLYEATIERGEPSVPQPVPDVTQYVAWEWAPPERLEAAAARGSLCSLLALRELGRDG